MGNLQRFIEVGDSSGVETIWGCCVTCLGHLAALSHLVGQREPTLRGLMDGLCNLTLAKLVDLSNEVHVERYSYFDVLTEVCAFVILLWTSKALTGVVHQISWKRALDTIDVRIVLRSHTEGELLRYWRGVIGRVHADFRAKLLRCGPSPSMLLVPLVDGRTEDSEFPNLLLDSGREPYGL